MDESYRSAIEAAKAETQTLLQQRATIDARLAQLKKTIESLSCLLEDTSEYELLWEAAGAGMLGAIADSGITDAIRQLLSRFRGPLTPVQIRDRLAKEGFDINSYASGLTVIHNTLKRLERQGEITLVRSPDGIAAYALPRVKNLPSLDDPNNPLCTSGIRDFKEDHPDKK
ncbi:MAG: hypothetical protein ACLQBK_02475 [Candidatus Sulfotelmatobacter sp.]